jgi:hypothetical protein
MPKKYGHGMKMAKASPSKKYGRSRRSGYKTGHTNTKFKTVMSKAHSYS